MKQFINDLQLMPKVELKSEKVLIIGMADYGDFKINKVRHFADVIDTYCGKTNWNKYRGIVYLYHIFERVEALEVYYRRIYKYVYKELMEVLKEIKEFNGYFDYIVFSDEIDFKMVELFGVELQTKVFNEEKNIDFLYSDKGFKSPYNLNLRGSIDWGVI